MKKGSLTERIRGVGFRATKPRLLLLSFLEKAKSPLSILEIAAKLKGNGIDQVTVYRMVDAFKRAGLVREVNVLQGRSQYELNDVENDHHHIVCTNCHKVEDFIGCDSQRVEKKALNQSRSFSTITGHSFDLYGLCNTCTK